MIERRESTATKMTCIEYTEGAWPSPMILQENTEQTFDTTSNVTLANRYHERGHENIRCFCVQCTVRNISPGGRVKIAEACDHRSEQFNKYEDREGYAEKDQWWYMNILIASIGLAVSFFFYIFKSIKRSSCTYLLIYRTMYEPITAIQEILKAAVADESSPLNWIKKVYFGDPVIIPESSLPALCVIPKSDEYDRRWSRYDQKEHIIEIRLVYNQKSYFGKSQSDPENVFVVEDALLKIGEVSSHSTDALTVCWLIQQHPTLQYSWWYASEDCRVLSVTYELTEMRWYNTYEAIVQVRVTVIGDR